jgi:rubrerythrin|tara:strand:+ start:307 stop:879 length:573 start_codon:yes stop_codon:yes gene_type:complete
LDLKEGDIKMSNTEQNLEAAFAGESQANRKYHFFAEMAAKEGYPGIESLFRAAADAEMVHARSHLQVMGGIGSTKDNLEAAISGENYEFTKMYPEFIEQAKAENNERAEMSFANASKAEKVHHGLYQQALSILEEGKQVEDAPYFVCQVCGNVILKEAPDKCPICNSLRRKFKRIELGVFRRGLKVEEVE